MNQVKAAPAKSEAKESAHPELQTLLEFWKTHGRAILWGVVFAAAVALLFIWRAQSRSREAAEAAQAFARAGDLPEQLEEIVRRYGGTPTGPAALLALAARRFEMGAPAVALGRYDEFLKKYGGHGMAPVAELGRAHALEALGRTDEALAAFSAFVEKHGDHFLIPQATLGRARCLAQAGRWAEARAALEDFIAAHPGNPWLNRMETALAEVSRRERAAAAASAGATPALPPLSAPAP